MKADIKSEISELKVDGGAVTPPTPRGAGEVSDSHLARALDSLDAVRERMAAGMAAGRAAGSAAVPVAGAAPAAAAVPAAAGTPTRRLLPTMRRR